MNVQQSALDTTWSSVRKCTHTALSCCLLLCRGPHRSQISLVPRVLARKKTGGGGGGGTEGGEDGGGGRKSNEDFRNMLLKK